MSRVGQFGTILVPVDFSQHCDEAVHHAAWFAGVCGGEVHLVHVIANPLDDLYETHDVLPLQVVDRAEATAHRLLAEVGSRCLPPGIRHSLHVRHGDPFEKIVAVVKDVGPHLIVLSTHGRGGVRHLVMGSVAEKIVRHAPCPMFIVPRPRASLG